MREKTNAGLSEGTIRVLLADDHQLLREGVAALIQSHPDLTVVGQSGAADEAVELCRSLAPEVAVIDLSMPGNGIQAIERIARLCPGTRCVALTMHDDTAYVRAALAAGAAGYVIKGAASEELVAAIRAVAAGRSFVQISVGEKPSSNPPGSDSDTPPGILSRREQQVLVGLAQGFTNREIAERLGLSTKTVDTYRTRLQDKLGVTGRAALVAYAWRAGLLELPA